MSTLAFTSLPPEVQAFLKEKGLHRFKTVEVSPFYREDVVRELPPIPVNLENPNKPAAYSYAVSPSGHSVKANYNRIMGAWPHHTEEVAESIQLPVEHGPWTIIHVPRNWAGAELGVSIRHGKLDTRYQSQKSKLTGLAAAMLYVYAKTRGMYRKRSTEAMESYERQVGPVWIVVRDELLEQGLVTIQKGGQLRVTPRGAEVAGRIPPSYDPDNWVYRRTAEATHMPSEGLFGAVDRKVAVRTAAATRKLAFNVITGRRSNPPNVVVSTVKLPDFGDGDAPFETMVFPSTEKGALLDLKALDSARTDDESEALRQHRRMVQKWAVGTSFNGLPPRVLSPEQRAELLQRYYGGEEMTTRRVAKMPRPEKTHGGGPKPLRTVDNAAAVRAAYEAGVPVRTLAQQHGVSYRQVHNLTRGIDNETARMRRRLLQAGLPEAFTIAQAAQALRLTTKGAAGFLERMVKRGLVKKEALGPPRPTQYRLGDMQYPPTGERVTYG